MNGDPDTRLTRLEERHEALRDVLEERRTALELQAKEYDRRLSDLNHEHERVRSIQLASVDQERFEIYTKTEAEKRETALTRVNEKFDDYVARYELRQREIDQLLAASEGAQRQVTSSAEDAARRSNRNIGIASIVIIIFVAVANYLGGSS